MRSKPILHFAKPSKTQKCSQIHVLHPDTFQLYELYVQTILLKLFCTLRRKFPRSAVLCELLHRRSQLRVVQGEIIHASDAQNAHPRESSANTVHERATGRAEIIGHGIVLAWGLDKHCTRLCECLEVLAAARMLQVGVIDGEVCCVDGGGELVAVGAVADEGTDEARTVGWLSVLENSR